MAEYTIRELENLSGIKAHTIRIWEKRYGLIAPHRTSTNIRTYCDTELKKLLNISILNRNGMKISMIAKLSHHEMIDKINQYTKDFTSTENQIENLTLAMIDLDEYRFEQILARIIIQFGFEEAVTRVLYPFMVKIGLMWQTGSINAAQEHFISSLIRQKFFVAIDSLINKENSEALRFVFFLPEGEQHEIGLLFFYYLTKKYGHRTIYLGQSMPFNDLSEIAKTSHVDCLVTSFTTSIRGNSLKDYIQKLSSEFVYATIFVSGQIIQNLNKELPENVIAVSSPLQFLKELGRLS
jgi:MerR family transcriptional regulator, light-induced transcriptional regulator